MFAQANVEGCVLNGCVEVEAGGVQDCAHCVPGIAELFGSVLRNLPGGGGADLSGKNDQIADSNARCEVEGVVSAPTRVGQNDVAAHIVSGGAKARR